jgi:hypothetical protein
MLEVIKKPNNCDHFDDFFEIQNMEEQLGILRKLFSQQITVIDKKIEVYRKMALMIQQDEHEQSIELLERAKRNIESYIPAVSTSSANISTSTITFWT